MRLICLIRYVVLIKIWWILTKWWKQFGGKYSPFCLPTCITIIISNILSRKTYQIYFGVEIIAIFVLWIIHCDLIAASPKVNLRYLKDAEIYLEEDIRMEREDFMQMDAWILEEYINAGKKADSIRTLLKLLKKWRMRFMTVCSRHTMWLRSNRGVIPYLKTAFWT